MTDSLKDSQLSEGLEVQVQSLSLDEHSNDLEQLLVDRLGEWRSSDGFIVDFLVDCYRRVEGSGRRDRLATELKYLLVSYLGLVLTMPAMFQQPELAIEKGPDMLIPRLTGIDGVADLPAKLLSDMVQRFAEDDEQFMDIFQPITYGIVATMTKEGLLGRFTTCLDALQRLLQFDPLRKLLINGTYWKPPCEVFLIGSHTILGGILSVGVDSMELGPLHELLPNREQLYESQVESTFYALRTAAQLLTSRTHQLMYSFLKSDPLCKEATLEWFAWLAVRNGDRLKMHVDPKTVTPNRIMINAYSVLLLFCEPFLSPSSPKISLIDSNYYFRSARIDVKETTKNHATSPEYESFLTEFYKPTEQYSPNFVTECFFLTVQFFRLGPVRMINEYMDLLRDLRETQQALDSFEGSQRNVPGPAAAMNAMAIRNAKAQLQLMKDIKLSLDVYLLDTQLMDKSFSFVILIVRWLLTLFPPNMELPTEPPASFAMLPEFLVECIGEYSLFISRLYPQFWLGNRPLDLLMQFMTLILDRPLYVKNPYLRAKFVDYFFIFTDPRLEHFFDMYPLVVEHLSSKLMRFYIEVESTGASSQFYDKFNIRFNISRIIKTLWNHPSHRERIIACSRYLLLI